MFQVLVEVLVPVFVVVAVGFLVARTSSVEPRTLASLAYWVLGPASIFVVLSTTTTLAPDVVARVVGATILILAVVAVSTALVMRMIGVSFSTQAATVLTSMHGNFGNFGLAICAFAFGEEVRPIAGIVMVTVNTLGIVTGVGLATVRDGSVARGIGLAVASPLALAVLPALLVNLTNTDLPIWLDRPLDLLDLLASALIPVMMLTLGIQPAGMRRTSSRRCSGFPSR